MKKLPDRDSQLTGNRLTLHFPIHIIFNRFKGLDIIEGEAPYKISTDNRITKTILQRFKPVLCKPNPIKLAQKYQTIYEQSETRSINSVAEQFGISRIRVYQLMSLLKLDKRIISYLLSYR